MRYSAAFGILGAAVFAFFRNSFGWGVSVLAFVGYLVGYVLLCRCYIKRGAKSDKEHAAGDAP